MTYRDKDIETHPTGYVIAWSVAAILIAILGWLVIP